MEGDPAVFVPNGKLSKGSHFPQKLQGGQPASRAEGPESICSVVSKPLQSHGDQQVSPRWHTLAVQRSQGCTLSRKLGALILALSSSLLVHRLQHITSPLLLGCRRWEVLHASSRPHLSPDPEDTLLIIRSCKLIRIRIRGKRGVGVVVGQVLGPLLPQNILSLLLNFPCVYVWFLQQRDFGYIP